MVGVKSLRACYKLYLNKVLLIWSKYLISDHQCHIQKGKKSHYDTTGNNLNELGKIFSLHHLLSNCTNFANKKADLDHLCINLSTSDSTITVIFTPKILCEITGKGIEYSWGLSKKYHRHLPCQQKRSFHQFFSYVKLLPYQVSLSINR